MSRLIGFICAEHGYVNVENSNGLCPHCGRGAGERKNTNGKTTYSQELGMEISSKDIDRVCKEKGLVYLSDREISQEVAKNKEHNERRQKEQFSNGLRGELRNVFK